jgi:hypothetical protein
MFNEQIGGKIYRDIVPLRQRAGGESGYERSKGKYGSRKKREADMKTDRELTSIDEEMGEGAQVR